MTHSSSVYRFCQDARYRKVAGEGVVLQQTSAEIIMLNQTGSFVLELIDGERSVQDIVERMSADYEADAEVLTKDVKDYIQQLVDAGVVAERTAETHA